MLYISDTSTNPYFNLAEEEFLLKNMQEDIFRLWRNSPSIIVGRYQNTIAEIDTEYTQTHHIPVVRRLTGGGAVFHDLGNLNFTFIQNLDSPKNASGIDNTDAHGADKKALHGSSFADTSEMFRTFTAPIIEALRSIGINACLQGRNDLSIDGLKFSGNAICIHKQRLLMHGTLMFDVSKTDLSKALKPRPEKFIGKAVKSNVKRVTNIKEHLTAEGILSNPLATRLLQEREKQSTGQKAPEQAADTLWLKQFLGDYICSHTPGITPYTFSEEQLQEIGELEQTRYRSDSWNFGKSPEYAFSNVRKFPSGIIELYFNVRSGKITDLNIQGDYFFTRPTEEFIRQIEGTLHTRESLRKKTGTLEVGAYFAGISSEDVVNLFF